MSACVAWLILLSENRLHISLITFISMSPSFRVTGGKGSYNRKCQPSPACILRFCDTHKQVEFSFLSGASELALSRHKPFVPRQAKHNNQAFQEEHFCQISNERYDGGGGFTRCVWFEAAGLDVTPKLRRTEEKNNAVIPETAAFFQPSVSPPHRRGQFVMLERSHFFTLHFLHECLLMIFVVFVSMAYY